MYIIKNLLEDKSNIAIIGGAGCGKGVVLKGLLTNLVLENKKVLMLEPLGEKEYKQVTDNLGGEYILYNSDFTISYNNNLTTVTFPTDSTRPNIELILSIIKEAESKGVEVILIDEAWAYLKECDNLIDNIHVQLIINTLFDDDILNTENVENFKKLFSTLFLMPCNSHIQIYQQLLNLYDINNIFVEDLKKQQRYESIVIQDKKVLETKLKFQVRES